MILHLAGMRGVNSENLVSGRHARDGYAPVTDLSNFLFLVKKTIYSWIKFIKNIFYEFFIIKYNLLKIEIIFITHIWGFYVLHTHIGVIKYLILQLWYWELLLLAYIIYLNTRTSLPRGFVVSTAVRYLMYMDPPSHLDSHINFLATCQILCI